MVDHSLEEFQRNQSGRISKEILEQNQDQQRKAMLRLQRAWEKARVYLIEILRMLDQDFVESAEKLALHLEAMTEEDLAGHIRLRLAALQRKVAVKESEKEAANTRRDLETCLERYAELDRVFLELQERNRKLQQEFTALEAHLSALQQVQVRMSSPGVPQETVQAENVLPPPDWLENWRRSRAYEKTSTAVLVMGESGLALRPSILQEMARRLSLSVDNPALNEVLRLPRNIRSEEVPVLIEEASGVPGQGSRAGGYQPAVLRLTTEGRAVYRLLSGKEPAENQYELLLKHHSSPEHTILNIQAAQILAAEGYQVQILPQQVQLSNGETYIPDLIAVEKENGVIRFIEVERDAYKEGISRKKKWIKVHEASHGNLFVFCDNLNCQRIVQGEINLALGDLHYNSSLTNLNGLRSGKRSLKDGSLWLSQRLEVK
ncbi:MAG: hypothetical protein NTZ74_01995 [Chloroflexi bacterium]|nr:hypothetical protein [Chloroflexota bacterium]